MQMLLIRKRWIMYRMVLLFLMHDIHESSVEASLGLISELVEKGYKLVTVQELAKTKGIDLEDGEVYYYFGEGTQEVE